MTIEELRAQIDAADEQLLAAFSKRMEIAGKIADYKREKGLPVLDSSRERRNWPMSSTVPRRRPSPMSARCITCCSS